MCHPIAEQVVEDALVLVGEDKRSERAAMTADPDDPRYRWARVGATIGALTADEQVGADVAGALHTAFAANMASEISSALVAKSNSRFTERFAAGGAGAREDQVDAGADGGGDEHL